MTGIKLGRFVLEVWIDTETTYDGGKIWRAYPAGMPWQGLDLYTDTKRQMETLLKREGFEKIGPVRSHTGKKVDAWRRVR